jgi:hypothetical protein
MEQWKAQSLGKCIDIYPDLARLILLLRHSPNITQIFTDMLADIFRWCLDLLSIETCGQNPPLGKHGLLHLDRVCFYIIEDRYPRGTLNSAPRTLDDFYDFLPELPSLRHYTHITVWKRGHTVSPLPSDYHLPKVEILDFTQSTEAIGVINSMIQACDNYQSFRISCISIPILCSWPKTLYSYQASSMGCCLTQSM